MSRGSYLGVLVGLSAFLLGMPVLAAEAPKEKAKKPQVEVVFCLDTTGSMGGLLDGAKQKIWAICNQIAGGKPTPDLKVGLVAYKDRGDEYVTKVFDLSTDLDAIHGELKKFTANGGGDEPESVNQGLDDAVNKIKWSTDKKTLRIIFLVGDAAPHMDYADDVKYPVTCKKAVEKGILINTIQCGNSAECTKYWKDIATKAEGSYAAIPQAGGVVAVATPFDARLAELNTELTKTAVVYGGKDRREAGLRAIALGGAGGATTTASSTPGAAPVAYGPADAAARAGFAGKTGKVLDGDLVKDLEEKKVTLEKIKEDELPDELKKLKTEKERKEYLEAKAKKRAELSKEAVELDKKRSDFVAKELEKKGKEAGKDSFDRNVLEMLRKQAKKYDLGY
jgi:Mg-chelatase subunit ChlD